MGRVLEMGHIIHFREGTSQSEELGWVLYTMSIFYCIYHGITSNMRSREFLDLTLWLAGVPGGKGSPRYQPGPMPARCGAIKWKGKSASETGEAFSKGLEIGQLGALKLAGIGPVFGGGDRETLCARELPSLP